MSIRAKLLTAFFLGSIAWMIVADLLLWRPRSYPIEIVIGAAILLVANRQYEKWKARQADTPALAPATGTSEAVDNIPVPSRLAA